MNSNRGVDTNPPSGGARSPAREPKHTERPGPARTSGALVVGAALGLLDVLVVLLEASARARVPLLGCAFAWAQQIALGAAATGVALLLGRLRGVGARAGVSLVAATLLAALVLRDDFATRASKWAGGGSATPLAVAMFGAAGGALVAAGWIGRALGRAEVGPLRHAAWAGLAAALLVQLANHTFFSRSYAGAHLWATLIAHALGSGAIRERVALPRLLTIGAGVVGTAGVIVAPPAATLAELLRHDGVSLAPELALVRVWLARRTHPLPPAPTDGPPRPPTAPGLGLERPQVVLVTIDCLRADILETDAASLPTFRAFAASAQVFDGAHTAAPATYVSIASLMMGRLYEQQYWVPRSAGGEVLPHLDETPRLPAVLAADGVDTAIVASADWMTPSFGIVPGFARVRVLPKTWGGAYARAGEVFDALADEAVAARSERAFLYAHVLDPHAPYDMAGSEGTARARYVRELAQVDAAFGRFLERLDASPARDRTVVIVSADHGEAFGEHGAEYHGTNLYEEVLRVPLWIRVPGRPARVVRGLASTLDLAPTVSDALGVPIPSGFMGATLVPTLRGGELPAGRAIVANSGRLMRAMLLPDRLKVIEDTRHGVAELYDLEADPGELRNLYDETGEVRPELEQLRAFFALHALRREGYTPPFRLL